MDCLYHKWLIFRNNPLLNLLGLILNNLILIIHFKIRMFPSRVPQQCINIMRHSPVRCGHCPQVCCVHAVLGHTTIRIQVFIKLFLSNHTVWIIKAHSSLKRLHLIFLCYQCAHSKIILVKGRIKNGGVLWALGRSHAFAKCSMLFVSWSWTMDILGKNLERPLDYLCDCPKTAFRKYKMKIQTMKKIEVKKVHVVRDDMPYGLSNSVFTDISDPVGNRIPSIISHYMDFFSFMRQITWSIWQMHVSVPEPTALSRVESIGVIQIFRTWHHRIMCRVTYILKNMKKLEIFRNLERWPPCTDCGFSSAIEQFYHFTV